MVNYIHIGALTVGTGGVSYAAFKILIAGLYITGVFYASSPTDVGIDLVGEYGDFDLSFIGIDSTLPIPIDSINDVTVEWVVYDEGGVEINRDSHYVGSISKGVPFFVKKESILKRDYRGLGVVTVKVKVSGKASFISISKEKTITLDASRLIDTKIDF